MTKIETIPVYLKEHGLFCLWKYEDRGGRKTKMPYNPNNPQYPAKSNDPATFAPLKTAESVVAGFDGLGVGMFGEVAGIDIDHCMKDGKLSDMAADIVETMDAYTEVSPSGEGLRILFLAPGFQYDTDRYYVKESGLGLELYIAGMTNRFLTITGNTIRPQDMIDRKDRLQGILDKYMKRPEKPQAETTMPQRPLNISDQELLYRAMNSRNGALFRELWEGNITSYSSQSEADISLCNMLAFWTGRDANRMDSLFRQSGLMREKWNRKQSGTTYGAITIQKAIADCVEVYTPVETQEADSSLANIESHRAENMRADFFRAINEGKRYSPVSTGIYAVDMQLGGGLFPGLYFLAGLPGSGKTTLFLQFADNIAKNGRDVLLFSMEMAKENMIARSISREIYAEKQNVSEMDILQGKVNVDPIAEKYFSTIGKHLSIYEGRKTADRIYDTVKAYTEKTGRAPVVVVDYLQLIDPEKRDVRESVNHSVDIFAKIRREFKTPVLVISSMSRSNYDKSSSESMFKESGEIEFTADCLLTMSYRNIEYGTQTVKGRQETLPARDDRIKRDTQIEKKKPTRELKLSVIKNRFSEISDDVSLNYVPKCNHFSVPR